MRDADPRRVNGTACVRKRAISLTHITGVFGCRPQDDFDPSEPLVKPTEVSAPDETEHNAAVETLKKKIDGGEEKIKALDAEIEVLKGVREKQNAATKGLRYAKKSPTASTKEPRFTITRELIKRWLRAAASCT